LGQLRHAPVKGGIEARHLGQTGEAGRHRLDALDFCRQMEGGIGGQPPQIF
jgi:hypothetical protein